MNSRKSALDSYGDALAEFAAAIERRARIDAAERTLGAIEAHDDIPGHGDKIPGLREVLTRTSTRLSIALDKRSESV